MFDNMFSLNVGSGCNEFSVEIYYVSYFEGMAVGTHQLRCTRLTLKSLTLTLEHLDMTYELKETSRKLRNYILEARILSELIIKGFHTTRLYFLDLTPATISSDAREHVTSDYLSMMCDFFCMLGAACTDDASIHLIKLCQTE